MKSKNVFSSPSGRSCLTLSSVNSNSCSISNRKGIRNNDSNRNASSSPSPSLSTPSSTPHKESKRYKKNTLSPPSSLKPTTKLNKTQPIHILKSSSVLASALGFGYDSDIENRDPRFLDQSHCTSSPTFENISKPVSQSKVMNASSNSSISSISTNNSLEKESFIPTTLSLQHEHDENNNIKHINNINTEKVNEIQVDPVVVSEEIKSNQTEVPHTPANKSRNQILHPILSVLPSISTNVDDTPNTALSKLKERQKKQDGLILVLTGQVNRRKQLLFGAQEQASQLAETLRQREQEVLGLKKEVGQLKGQVNSLYDCYVII